MLKKTIKEEVEEIMTMVDEFQAMLKSPVLVSHYRWSESRGVVKEWDTK